MFSQRKPLRNSFDPLFSKKYYLFERDKDSTSEVSFPLPESHETLKAFFDSEEGKVFKKTFKAIIDELVEWAIKNKLDPAELIKFEASHNTNYSGINKEMNKINFPLYQQGIPGLYFVLKLIQSEKIPLDKRKDIVRNLIEEIKKCGPGCFRQIGSAKVKLESHFDLSKMHMEGRQKIAEQVVLELIKKFPVPEGFEVHYVNGVLNYYADELGIPMYEDEYVKSCDPNIIHKLIEQFENIFPAKMITVETFIEEIVAKLNLEEFFKKLMTQGIGDEVDNLRAELDFYGNENDFFTDINGIIVEEETLVEKKQVTKYHLAYDAQDIFFLSLFKRLKQAGYINPDVPVEQKQLSDGSTICYIPSHSQNFAYVYNPKAEKKYQPFLSYCVEKFLSNDQATQELIKFIKEQSLVERRLVVVQAIARYLKSVEYDIASDKDGQLAKLINVIPLIIPAHYMWEILDRLPDSAREQYMQIIRDKNQIKTELVVDKQEQLIKIFKHFDRLSSEEKNILLRTCKSRFGEMSLVLAAQNGFHQVVQWLLRSGFSPNFTIPPLLEASKAGHLETVKVLLADRRTDPNLKNINSQRALISAAANGHADIVKALLVRGAHVNEVNIDKNTALILAAKNGHYEVVLALLQVGAKVDIANEENRTALSFAAEGGYDKIVQALLTAGANPNIADIMHTLPLHDAARQGHIEVVKTLLAHQVNPNVVDNDNLTPLLLATVNKRVEVVKELLEKKADPNIVDHYKGRSALMVAVQMRDLTLVNILLEKDADPNISDIYGVSPLFFAAEKGSLKIVKALLEKKADPNVALLVAVKNGHQEVVKLLLEFNANPNFVDSYGQTALMFAALEGSLEITKLLLQAGAKSEVVDENNKVAVYIAARTGHLNIVEELLLHGANIDFVSQYKISMLMDIAAVQGCQEQVRALFKGVKAEAVADFPLLLLFAAIITGKKKLVSDLIEKGVNVNQKIAGVSAIQLAKAMDYSEIQEILIKKTLFTDAQLSLTQQEEQPRDVAIRNLHKICQADYLDVMEPTSKHNAINLFLELDALAQQLMHVANTYYSNRKQRNKSLADIKKAVEKAYLDFPEKIALKQLKDTISTISQDTKKDQATKVGYRIFGKTSKLAKKLDQIIPPKVAKSK